MSAILQKDNKLIDSIPANSAIIIDGMNVVQKITGAEKTFEGISKSIFNFILNEGKWSDRIDVVFDSYEKMSIKQIERKQRGEETSTQDHAITGAQIVRGWRNFLKSTSN